MRRYLRNISGKLKKPFHKTIAMTLALSILFEMVPTRAFALTGGPSQPEVQGFTPVSTSDMVNISSGSFTYNIPLLNVDGYPINIAYNSGITMDQEASWVGLGWNLNPGAVNRTVRGIPDDFDGETIERDFNMKHNDTYGGSFGFGAEIFGFPGGSLGLSTSIGVHYNNYNGVGADLSINLALSAGLPGNTSLTGGLGLTSSSDDGATISPSLGLGVGVPLTDGASVGLGLHVGCSYNSREGLSNFSFGVSASISQNATDANGSAIQGGGSASQTLGAVGGTFNCMMPTYTPQVQMSMTNLSITGNFKSGGALFGVFPNYDIGGYFTSQTLAQTVVQNQAYGYMHAEDGVHNQSAMMDFNREKDGPFTPYTPDLPLTNFTYDIFSASGQGMSGSFRPFRGDLGHVFDPATTTSSNGYSVGAEVGFAGLWHAGVDFTSNSVTSASGDWIADNNAAPYLSFTKSVSGNALYEPVYFKEANEKSVSSDPSFFDKVGGFTPQRIHIDHPADYDMIADGSYESGLTVSPNGYRKARDIRNQSISYLTHAQVEAGLGYDDANTISHLYNAQPYHIGEVTTIGTEGKRYVYGIAAYNTDKEEVTFATGVSASGTGGSQATPRTGLVAYNSGQDNTTGNQLGNDNYYSNIKTPPYAYSYLLTSVLSPDYVDADGVPGPSAGDLGTWTKFNYTNPVLYNWRTPLGADSASFNEGLKSNVNDDKANYLYGTKQIYYLQSIETKNYIAVFYTSARQDGFGVQDQNGALSLSQSVSKLDSIALYTKPNYNAATATGSTIPLQAIETVHFNYDYSLCPGVPNNSNYTTSTTAGKLTLKSIYFTYQNSFKGRLSPYQFTYNSAVNYPYRQTAYDRWGFYKPFTPGAQYGNAGATGPLTPAEYPYVDQTQSEEDLYAAAWTLTDITLPSGGDIHVDYESNDYAYVQNQPAMQMFLVDGSQSGSSGISPASVGSIQGLSSPSTPNFTLDFPVPLDASGNPVSTDMNKYFNGIEYLYFRFLTQITQGSLGTNYEYVSGYSRVINKGYDATTKHGWVTLVNVDLDDTLTNQSGGINPICKAAIQYGRLNVPREVWQEPSLNTSGFESVILALGSSLGQFASLGHLNSYIYKENYCQNFVAGKSWIRLCNPTGKKLGGGARVKDVLMNDEWSTMTTTEKSFSYGQQYCYTMADGVTSSGVASYEPQVGGDENPWRTPVFYEESRILAPDDTHYMETPFGESFFPSPGITYSRVTVKNLKHTGVHRDATGSVVHEFYTTYDFPTITNRTDLYQQRDKTDPASITSLLNNQSMDFMTASQGYTVENNDMNGKPKAQYVYQENQNVPISSVEYYYQQTPLGNNSFQLNNTVTAVNGDGSLNNNAQVGVFFDNIQDFRQSETDNNSFAVQGNVDCFLLFAFPAIIPTFWPSTTTQTTRFRSAVTTKVIERMGLLDSTIVTDLGSRVKTQNLAYDAQTGDVLLTKTANDYNDPIYNLTYPAYWYYDGMGQVYKNIGLTLSNAVFTSTGTYSIPNAPDYFERGDELALTRSGSSIRAWVTNVSSNSITAEVENGTLVPANKYTLEIIRSGRRNMQSMDMAKITTLVNPINSLQSNSYQKITQASAKVYTDSWRTYCNCFDQPGMQTTNPYVLGIRGDYHLKTSYLYLTSRDQSNFDNNTNTRKDGTFTSYNPFYSDSIGQWWTTPNNWTYTSTVTDFNPYGQEIEDRDALGRYSSATFGFNQTLPTAVAANAQYGEIGFDGFEDWGYNGCADNHFDMNRSAMALDATQSHTGRHSLLVGSTPVVIGGLMTTCTPPNPCNISLCALPEDQTGEFNLALQPSGGAAPYTFNYTVVSGQANGTIQADGNLHLVSFGSSFTAKVNVTVKDSKGCKYETTVNISENTLNGGYTITGANTSCQPCNLSLCYATAAYGDGHSITLTPSGGTAPYTYTYNIISGVNATGAVSGNNLIIEDNADFQNFSADITVTDANGCSYQTTITGTYSGGFTRVSSFAVGGANPCNCNISLCYNTGGNDDRATVTIVPSGGTAPYTYSYSPSSGTVTTTTLSNGDLRFVDIGSRNFSGTITVTDATGCTYEATINASYSDSGYPTITGISPCDCSVALCYSSTGNVDSRTFTLTPSGGVAGYTYGYSITGTNASASVVGGNLVITDLASTNFSANVVATDANGCHSSLYTISVTFDSQGNFTVTGISPCCTIPMCYTQTRDANIYHVYLAPSGGTAPYNYIETVTSGTGVTAGTFGNDCVIHPTQFDNFTVNVTGYDANGCIYQGTITGTFDMSTGALTITGISPCE